MTNEELREALGEIAVALNDVRLEAPAMGQQIDVQPIIDSLAELDLALAAIPEPLAILEGPMCEDALERFRQGGGLILDPGMEGMPGYPTVTITITRKP